MFIGATRSTLAQAARIAWFAMFATIATANVAIAQVAGEVRGRITDAATAQPIANVRVEAAGRSEAVRSGADGGFVMRGLVPGTFAVTVRALGYAVLTQEIEVTNGRVTLMDVALVARVAVLREVQTRAARDTTALNTTVLDRTSIEQSGQRDVGELLQTTPSILITQAGGPGQESRVSIRGSSASQVLVVIDGVPFNSTISGGADLSRISLESVEKITVRIGAQSARYGPRAMAGVIEIETRTPSHESSTFVRTGALGEHAASASISNATERKRAKLGASFVADYRTVNGDFSYDLPALRGGGRATRINSDATSTQFTGGLTLDRARTSVSLRGTWADTKRGLAGTIVQPSSTGRQGNSRLSAGGSAQGFVRRVAWTLGTAITHEDATFTDRSPPFGQAFDDSVSATGITTSTSVTIGSGPATLSGGAELRTLDITSTMLAPGAPHWQQLLGAWSNTRFTHRLSANLRADAELSGRIDRSSLSDDAVISPRGTLRVSRGVWSTSVSLGSGYAPPTLSDQFFHEGVQVRANPTLKPERTRQDIEGRVTLRETVRSVFTLSGTAAAYRANVDGMILWFPDFQFVWSPTNYDVKRSGWELTGKVRAVATHLEVSGTFDRSDVTYTGEVLHGQVVYRPRNSANLLVSYAPRPFRLDVTTRHVGTRRTVAGSSLNSLAPYAMSDVRASTSLATHNWTFTPALGVENVFDRAAAMLVDYPFPPRTWSISLRMRRSTSPS